MSSRCSIGLCFNGFAASTRMKKKTIQNQMKYRLPGGQHVMEDMREYRAPHSFTYCRHRVFIFICAIGDAASDEGSQPRP